MSLMVWDIYLAPNKIQGFGNFGDTFKSYLLIPKFWEHPISPKLLDLRVLQIIVLENGNRAQKSGWKIPAWLAYWDGHLFILAYDM